MILAFPLLLACGPGDDAATGDDDDDTAGTTDPVPPSATIALTDAHQLTYDHAEDIPVFSVSPGRAFSIDWGGLSTDVWGRPASPVDVGLVVLALRVEPLAAVLSSLAEEGPDRSFSENVWSGLPAGTSTPASGLLQVGFAFDPAQMRAGQVYTAAVLDDEGKALSVAVAEVSGGADDVTLGAARYGATLALSPRAPSTGSGLRPWTIDWSALTTDATGMSLDPASLDTLFLTRWTSEAVVDVLEPAAADGYWAKYVPGTTSIDPETISGLDGEPFPGFEAGGVYAVGFRCVDCATALPRFASRILVPE